MSLLISGPKGENECNLVYRNWVDHNVVAPNLVETNVVDPNILDNNLLNFIALVQSELSKFRTASGGKSKFSVQGRSRSVKIKTVVVIRQQYQWAVCEKLESLSLVEFEPSIASIGPTAWQT